MFKFLAKLMKPKRHKKKQRKYTKKQRKAHRKELYYSKWCVVGNLVKFRPAGKSQHIPVAPFDPGILAWETYEDCIDYFNPKMREGRYSFIKDYEEMYVVIVDVRRPKNGLPVVVQILTPERLYWVRRQDLRKRKEQRI